MRSLLADTLPNPAFKLALTGAFFLVLMLAGCGGESVAEVSEATDAESPVSPALVASEANPPTDPAQVSPDSDATNDDSEDANGAAANTGG